MWESPARQNVVDLLQRLHGASVPVAAICAATLEIARAGLTPGTRHTSNARDYLQKMVPGYTDGESYVNELAVTDGTLITASGLGSLEFAREILKMLKVYSDAETQMWFEMFKSGVIPKSLSYKS